MEVNRLSLMQYRNCVIHICKCCSAGVIHVSVSAITTGLFPKFDITSNCSILFFKLLIFCMYYTFSLVVFICFLSIYFIVILILVDLSNLLFLIFLLVSVFLALFFLNILCLYWHIPNKYKYYYY